MSIFRRALWGDSRRTMTLAELDNWLDTAQYGGGKASDTGLWIDPSTAMTSAVVYACVNVLAQTIGALPLIVYRRLPNGGKERAPEHRLYNILHDAANSEMTAYELRACLVGHQCLWGNAYCEIERSDAGVKGLWPLRPDRMTPARDADNRLVYDYRLPSGELKRFQFSQIMHWRGLSSNGIIGYSPIRQAAESVGLDLATRKAGATFFGNDSRPGGVLRHPGKLSKDGASRLKDSWESLHKGLDQRQRVAVLEEGVEWQQIGIPPEEAQFLETRKYGRSEIAGLYRVPLHMINDLDRATFSNVEHIALEFVKFTLMPWLIQIEQAIKRDLFGISEGKRAHFAEHLVEGLLRGDSQGRAAYLQTMRMNGALNADEWRELDNLNPIPGGKGQVFWQPANMLELGDKPAPAPTPAPGPADDTADEDADSADADEDMDDSDNDEGRTSVRYSPDQPRGKDGKWVYSGGEAKVSALVNDPSFYNRSTEKSYIYADDGSLIKEIEGGEDGINLSGVMKTDTQNAHFVHNHPASDLASDTWTFSDLDIETAVDGNFSTMTATGKYRTYTMTRPPDGWPNHQATMKATQTHLKVSDKYMKDFLHFRDGLSFGDSPETLNRAAKKFWKAYAEKSGATYTEAKRK